MHFRALGALSSRREDCREAFGRPGQHFAPRWGGRGGWYRVGGAVRAGLGSRDSISRHFGEVGEVRIELEERFEQVWCGGGWVGGV